MSRKITHDEFIKKCLEVHENKYDYSITKYNGYDNYIDIICNKHGIFKQKASIHKSGSGCQQCCLEEKKKRKRVSNKEFIEKANLVHNNYYSYNSINYLNAYTKIIITCPIHNNFEQVPHDHLKGSGCPQCSRIKVSKNKIKNNNTFIKQAKETHKDCYDYSKVKYKGSFTLIKIICKKHGEFWQKPAYHLSGAGCPECALNKKSYNTSWFVKKSNEIHNNEYFYDKTNYINIMEKVILTCKKHGDFEQRAQDHLKGSGCRFCKGPVSKIENKYFNYLNNPNIIRNSSIYINNKRFVPDGYDPKTNIIYEFNGDYWHGNIKIFNKDDIHPVLGITFGELYKNTIDKEKTYKKAGYKVVSIWENEFKKIISK